MQRQQVRLLLLLLAAGSGGEGHTHCVYCLDLHSAQGPATQDAKPQQLGQAQQLLLRVTQALFSMSQALSIRKLAELVQVGGRLLSIQRPPCAVAPVTCVYSVYKRGPRPCPRVQPGCWAHGMASLIRIRTPAPWTQRYEQTLFTPVPCVFN